MSGTERADRARARRRATGWSRPSARGASATVYLADDVQLRRRVAVRCSTRRWPTTRVPDALPGRGPGRGRAQPPQHHGRLRLGRATTRRPYLVPSTWAAAACAPCSTAAGCSPRRRRCWWAWRRRRGLDYAHRRGLRAPRHQAGQPAVRRGRRLRIADFGLARAIAEAAWTEPAGVVLGTARYASPEQARGEPVDGKSDVYSLALTLVEAVTGQVPFAADTTVATLMARLDRLMPVLGRARSAGLGPRARRASRPRRALDRRPSLAGRSSPRPSACPARRPCPWSRPAPARAPAEQRRVRHATSVAATRSACARRRGPPPRWPACWCTASPLEPRDRGVGVGIRLLAAPPGGPVGLFADEDAGTPPSHPPRLPDPLAVLARRRRGRRSPL